MPFKPFPVLWVAARRVSSLQPPYYPLGYLMPYVPASTPGGSAGRNPVQMGMGEGGKRRSHHMGSQGVSTGTEKGKGGEWPVPGVRGSGKWQSIYVQGRRG
jgi:hypothetical protein